MEFKAIIKDPIGLHARPASIIVQAAGKFKSDLSIKNGDKTGNLKSIMSVMSLGAKNGSEITIIAEGDDASEALEAIKKAMQDSEFI